MPFWLTTANTTNTSMHVSKFSNNHTRVHFMAFAATHGSHAHQISYTLKTSKDPRQYSTPSTQHSMVSKALPCVPTINSNSVTSTPHGIPVKCGTGQLFCECTCRFLVEHVLCNGYTNYGTKLHTFEYIYIHTYIHTITHNVQ